MFSKRLRKRLTTVFVLLIVATFINSNVEARLEFKPTDTVAEKFALFHENNNRLVNDFIHDMRMINDIKVLSKDPTSNISAINKERIQSYEPNGDLASKCQDSDQSNFNLSPLCLYTLMHQHYTHLLANMPSTPTQKETEFISEQKKVIPDILFHSTMYYAEFFTALPAIQELKLIEDQLHKVKRSLQWYKQNITRLKSSLPNATSTQCK